MPINIPTLSELRDRVKSDIENGMGVTFPLIGKNFLLTWAGVLSAKLKLIYNLLFFVSNNITPDTASSEAEGGTLEQWGRVKLGRNPFQSTNGVYSVEVTGVLNSVINAGQTFRSKEDATNGNKLFVSDNQVVLDVSPKTIQLRSLETGVDSLLSVGDKLVPSNPIVGLDSELTVLSVEESPLDEESIEDYRDKVVDAFRIEPQGGAVGDFRIWASDEQGVKTVYPYASDGNSGDIDIYVEASTEDSIDGRGTPSNDLIEALESDQGVLWLDPDTSLSINDRGRMPLTVLNTNILPVTPIEVQVTILGSVGFDPTIEASILTSLKNYLDTVRPYISGADVFSEKNDILSVNSLTFTVLETIPKNSYFGTLKMTVDGIEQTSIIFDKGNIPYIDTVTYS